MSPLPHNPNRATNPCSRLARVLVVLVAVCVLPTLLKAQIPVAEPVTVTDTVSFLDTLDNETITTTDAVTVTPLIAVAAPVVFYSAGSLGFNSVTTQSINVSAIGQAPLTLSSAAISKSSAFTVGPISCTNAGGLEFHAVHCAQRRGKQYATPTAAAGRGDDPHHRDDHRHRYALVPRRAR